MFQIFASYSGVNGMLMFNAGFSQGEAVGSYRGDPLYHASLDPSEYEALLTSVGLHQRTKLCCGPRAEFDQKRHRELHR